MVLILASQSYQIKSACIHDMYFGMFHYDMFNIHLSSTDELPLQPKYKLKRKQAEVAHYIYRESTAFSNVVTHHKSMCHKP